MEMEMVIVILAGRRGGALTVQDLAEDGGKRRREKREFSFEVGSARDLNKDIDGLGETLTQIKSLDEISRFDRKESLFKALEKFRGRRLR